MKKCSICQQKFDEKDLKQIIIDHFYHLCAKCITPTIAEYLEKKKAFEITVFKCMSEIKRIKKENNK
jgi:hypothetical protein